MNARLALAWGTFVLGAFTTACADPSVGQLAYNELDIPCGEEEAACERDGIDAPIAVGATLPLTLAPSVQGGTGPALRLEAVDERVALVNAAEVTGTGPGVTAILARIPGGDVIDLTHIWVDQARRMTLHVTRNGVIDERALEGRLDLLGSESDEVSFTFKLWSQGRELMGDCKETWTVETDADFILMNEGDLRARRLLLPEDGTGTATVTLTALGFTHTVVVEVVR
jgi:hypothetical protein